LIHDFFKLGDSKGALLDEDFAMREWDLKGAFFPQRGQMPLCLIQETAHGMVILDGIIVLLTIITNIFA